MKNPIKSGNLLYYSIIVSLLVLGGSISVYFLGHENPVEELIEDVIEQQTGINLDLTGDSDEVSNVVCNCRACRLQRRQSKARPTGR